MNFLSKDIFDDIIVVNEELVDISKVNAEEPVKTKRKYSKKNNKVSHYGEKTYNNKKSDNNKNGKKKIIIISSVAAAIVVALGVAGFCLFQNNVFTPERKAEKFTFAEGTSVSGISISGKTMEQAKKLLESNAESFIKPLNISVDANGDITTLTESDFEYTYDIDAVLSSIKTEATDPSAEKTTESKTYEITASVTPESILKNTKVIEKKTNKDAVNARVSKFTPYSENRFEYEEAQQGCKIDSEDLNDQLTEVIQSGTNEYRIIAKVETVEAKIKVDDVKNNIKKLVTYQTVSYNTANGTSNMKVSLEACNGSVIEPGATWSFNECTGDSNLESKGYKPAHVISEGQLVDGIGGGICQSSSTIYNAAVRANMEVEERYNHKWASAYVPTGLDATIDYPRLDLKLSNPTDYQMFMECKLVDSTLYVSIWGYKSPSYDIIKTYNELVSRDGDSYTVKAWRIYYKDGSEVDRESLGSSSYDNDNGYIFIDAGSDSNASYDNIDEIEETTESENSSSNNNSSSSSTNISSSTVTSSSSKPSSSKPSSSSQSQKPAPKPTQKPTQKPTEAPVQTEVPTNEPTDAAESETQ